MSSAPAISLQVSSRRFAAITASIAAVLVVANFAVIFVRLGLHHPQFFGLNRLFDLDLEANFPALFSTLLFFVNSGLLFMIAKIHRSRGGLSTTRAWRLLAWLFLFLGIDENVSIHELFVAIIRDRFPVGGVFYFAWVIPYGIATLILALCLIPWFCKLNPGTRWRFAAAAVIFVGGAIGVEMLGGRHFEGDHKDFIYYLFATLEESLEMTGLIVFAHALLSLLERERGTALQISIAREVTPAPLQECQTSAATATAIPDYRETN